ncbi:MAG: mechanosensitive ion channel family protein, partial [Tepidiformaceae bacterium]
MSVALTSGALFLLDVTKWSDWRRWWDDQRTTIGQHGTRIIIIFLLLLGLEILFRHVLRRMFVRAVSRAARVRMEDPLMVQRRADTLASTLQWAFGIFLLFLGVGLVLAEVGLNVSALIAGVGVVGIALGLGAQTLVKDVINGMFILLEDQYGVGDLVTAAGATGTVIEINPRRTVLRDADGNVHSIPNSSITVAVNRTASLGRIHIS